MTKKIRPTRDRMTRDRRWMDRARWKYAMLVRPAIELEPSIIDDIADRALERGLWSGTPGKENDRRSVRYSLLRRWWRADGGTHGARGRETGKGWHEWYSDRGWFCYAWKHQSDPSGRGPRMRLRA